MAVPPQRRGSNVALRAAKLCLKLLLAQNVSVPSSASSETRSDGETDPSSSGVDVKGLQQSLDQGGVDGLLTALSAMKTAHSDTPPVIQGKDGHEMYDWTAFGKSKAAKATALEDKSQASQQTMTAPLPIAISSPPASTSLGTLATPPPAAIAKVLSAPYSAETAQSSSSLHPRPVLAHVAVTNVPVRSLRGGQQLVSHEASEQPVVATSTNTTSDAEGDRLRSGLLDMRSRIDSLIGGAPGASLATIPEKNANDLTNKLSQQYRDMDTRVAALQETESKASQQNQDLAGRVSKLEQDRGKRNMPVYTQTKSAPETDDKARYQKLVLRLSALQKENQELKEEQSSQSDRIEVLKANETKELDELQQWQNNSTDEVQNMLKQGMDDLRRVRDDNARLKAKLENVTKLEKAKPTKTSFLAMHTTHGRLRARKKKHASKRHKKTLFRRKKKGRSRKRRHHAKLTVPR